MKFHLNKHVKNIGLIVVAILIFAGGYYAGTRTAKTYAYKETGGETALLGEVQSILNDKFIFWKASSSAPTTDDFKYGIVEGYVNAYKDPYTVFFPPIQAKQFTETVQGSFGGVGMNVGNKDGRIVVIAPLKDSPAQRAGIKAGDIILAVDGKDVTTVSTDEAVSLIRGEINTDVKITVLHKDAKLSSVIKITRAQIQIPTIDTEKKNGVFVIHLYNFSADSPDLFQKALKEFSQGDTQYLVLDLRGNPGGYLEAAVDMASFFLPEGSVVVTEKKGKTAEVINDRSKALKMFNDNLKMVVLVDGGSASASEILAGALKDHKIAKIVGEKTFGKGSVQELINLSDKSSLKVTIAKWYTPNGVSISESGIKPDIEIKAGANDDPANKIDTQLDKAIEIVKGLK